MYKIYITGSDTTYYPVLGLISLIPALWLANASMLCCIADIATEKARASTITIAFTLTSSLVVGLLPVGLTWLSFSITTGIVLASVLTFASIGLLALVYYQNRAK